MRRRCSHPGQALILLVLLVAGVLGIQVLLEGGTPLQEEAGAIGLVRLNVFQYLPAQLKGQNCK